MKRQIIAFLALILITGSFIFSSCAGKVATTGTLTVTAMSKDSTFTTPKAVAIYLATSKYNLDNHVYAATGYLNTSGSNIFRDLLPKNYWYKVEGWDDCGAIEVFAGLDESVILWLNTPSKK